MVQPAPAKLISASALWWRGSVLVLLATLCFSLQNILVKIAQSPQPIVGLGGWLKVGGYVTPDPHNPFQVTFLVLLVRISFVVPLLWLLLPQLNPQAWPEVKHIVTRANHRLKLQIFMAGFFLFLSQVLIYLAINKVGPATAVTIFFIYPTVTLLLAWRLFGDRPTWSQWIAITMIYTGCTWLAFSAAHATFQANGLGLIAAVASGVVFALEGIIAQSCFRQVNPATFTGMVFTVEWLVLLAVTLPFTQISLNSGLLGLGALLSCATLSGYLLNNFGIKAIGAAATAIIGSSGPAATALLNVFILSDSLNLMQWSAILLVTMGVLLINWVRLKQ